MLIAIMKTPKIMVLSFGLSLLACFFSGCGITAKFVYPADAKNMVRFSDGSKSNAKVAVVPFEDLRPESNSNKVLLYLIPFFPFGTLNYERPDAAKGYISVGEYDCSPTEDLAKAAAVSFRKSNLFRDAFFTFGGEVDRAEFILRGEIQKMQYYGRMWSYGLSVYGPLLWYFGLPAGNSHNIMEFSLSLRNQEGAEVWRWDSLKRKHYLTQGLYYNLGDDCIGFSRLYQQAMNDALQDLNREMQKNPLRFSGEKKLQSASAYRSGSQGNR